MPTLSEASASEQLDDTEQDISELSTGEVDVDQLPPRIISLCPVEGAVCQIVIATKTDPAIIGYPVDTEFKFEIGESDNDISNCLEEELEKLRAGQSCRIKLKEILGLCPNDHLGSECDSDLLLSLVGFENRVSVHFLNREQKFDIAQKHKAKGVELFKQESYKYAFKRFSKALKYLILMLPRREVGSDLTPQFDQLRVQCYANMAACQLKSKSYDYVVENCTKGLDIDPVNVKCLYRRAEAHYQQGRSDLARADVTRGLKVEPRSKALQQLLQKL